MFQAFSSFNTKVSLMDSLHLEEWKALALQSDELEQCYQFMKYEIPIFPNTKVHSTPGVS